MYSNVNREFCRIKDSLKKNQWIMIVGIFWIIASSFWNVYNQENRYIFYGFTASSLDYLISQQSAFYSGLTIFPFVIFGVIKCKQNSLNIQMILRYKSKKRVLKNQFMDSIIYAAISAFIIVCITTIIGWGMSGKLINWDSWDSVFFGQTGKIIDANFLAVVITIWFMYVVKYSILFAIVDITMWYPKSGFVVWIILLILLGIEGVNNKKVFFDLFAVQYDTWILPQKLCGLIMLGMVIFAVEYVIGKKIIRKKDILG